MSLPPRNLWSNGEQIINKLIGKYVMVILLWRKRIRCQWLDNYNSPLIIMFYEAAELCGKMCSCKIIVQNPDFIRFLSVFFFCSCLTKEPQVKLSFCAFDYRLIHLSSRNQCHCFLLNTPNSNVPQKTSFKRDTCSAFKRGRLVTFPSHVKRPSAEHSLSIGSLLDISNTPESSINYGGEFTFLNL